MKRSALSDFQVVRRFSLFFVDMTFDGESAKEVRTWEPKHKGPPAVETE